MEIDGAGRELLKISGERLTSSEDRRSLLETAENKQKVTKIQWRSMEPVFKLQKTNGQKHQHLMKIDGACRKLPKTKGKRPTSNEDRRSGSETPEIQWKTSNFQRRSTEPVGNFWKPKENDTNPVKIDGAALKLPKTNTNRQTSNEDRRGRP